MMSDAIVLDNVQEVYQYGKVQYYNALVKLEDIGKLKDFLIYDPEAQRGEVKGVKEIDNKHVNNIYNSIKNKESISGNLTWNVRKGESDGFFYDKHKQRIVISKNDKVTLPDSAHRHHAIFKIYQHHKDKELLETYFPVSIYNTSFDEEKQLFHSINGKGKTPSNNRILYLSNSKEAKVIRDSIDMSSLKGRVETVKTSTTGMNVVKFSTLYDAFFGELGAFKNYKHEEYNSISLFLARFFDELIKSREEFSYKTPKERIEKKRKSMVLEEISWWGYATLAEELIGDKNWKQKLKRYMNKKVDVEQGKRIDFLSKSNPIWHATVIKPRYNYITKTQELGTSVSNSSTTRGSVKKIFVLTLL